MSAHESLSTDVLTSVACCVPAGCSVATTRGHSYVGQPERSIPYGTRARRGLSSVTTLSPTTVVLGLNVELEQFDGECLGD
jgi:hypothetical protein